MDMQSQTGSRHAMRQHDDRIPNLAQWALERIGIVVLVVAGMEAVRFLLRH